MAPESHSTQIKSYSEFTPDNQSYLYQRIAQNEMARALVDHNATFDSFEASIINRTLSNTDDFFPGGRYFSTVEGPIRSGANNISTVADHGISIGYDICQDNPTAKGKIIGYLRALAGLDYLKVGLIGPASDTVTTNGIADYIRMTVASELPMKESTGILLDATRDAFEKAIDTYPREEIFKWFSAKVQFLSAVYKRQFNTQQIAGKYSESISDSEHSEEQLNSMAVLLNCEAMQHRKYGTKPAYIEASIGGSWIFYDGEDWRRLIQKNQPRNSSDQYDNIAAVVFHSPYDKLKSLKAGVDYDESGVGLISGGLAAAQPDTQLYIAKDGTIGLDPEGLQEIGMLGMPKPQELGLRAELSSIFYDLSMPVYKNRPERRNFATLTAPERDEFDPIQDLLIPRARFLGKNEQDNEQSDVVRSVREHDVTWFVRTLPAGYRASPEARIEAAQHGIVLEENETFVRSHIRGATRAVLGHRAVQRSRGANNP